MSAHALWARFVSSTLEELRRPGSVSLICGPQKSSCELMDQLGEALMAEPVSLTEVALVEGAAVSEQELLHRLTGRILLFDVEAICWSPWLQLDPLRLLHQHSRRQGVVVIWPGEISGRLVTFSGPGRRDYVSADAQGLGVLRPLLTTFPDEVPFSFERIPA